MKEPDSTQQEKMGFDYQRGGEKLWGIGKEQKGSPGGEMYDSGVKSGGGDRKNDPTAASRFIPRRNEEIEKKKTGRVTST